ncbi:MAG: TolC family protein [Nitrospirae bacterium]|nr:TolC family protein [Nitrospirota bacterium]
MRRVVLAVALFLLVLPYSAGAEDVINKSEVLTLKRCVEIALQKHPDIFAATGEVEVNQSRIGQAKANYYPQVEVSSGYKKYSSVSKTSNNSLNEYSTSATLKQGIYDFGKTSTEVDIQTLNREAATSDLRNIKERVVLNVKQAYYGFLQAKQNRDVADETVKQFDQHLQQAKGFYEAGTKPKFDVTKAEVDLSNAKLNLIKAANALRIAKVVLDNAMGIPNAPEYTIEDTLLYQKYNMTLKDAIDKAYENRPDLKSVITKKNAAESSIEVAKKGYYPTLSANAGYDWSGEKLPLQDGWNVGVTITLPIFSGYLTDYQVQEARANLNVLKAQEESFRQGVLLEVQQAYLNLREAEERISTAQLTVKQAQENLELANGRYAAGLGNPIEVTDAQISYSNAKTSHIQALSDYNVAMASLEKAMGVR